MPGNFSLFYSMYPPLQFAKKYFQYYLTASNGKGHGTHSPFVFDFIKNVLNDNRHFEAYRKIKDIRQQLMRDGTVITVDDFGAGNKMSKNRPISAIAKRSAVPEKLGRLLFRVSQYYQPKVIVELGTSLGLSGAYLASGNAGANLVTIEGSPAVAKVAAKNFQKLGLKNVELIMGDFDEKLIPAINHHPSIDLAYIDGNHRKDPVLRYLDALEPHMSPTSLIIFDDIHWSRSMEDAWAAIKNDQRIMLTVDLFFFGFVFFREDFKVKQHFTIRF